MSEENREATINTYLNSLRYAADGFLKEFLDKIDLSDRMILYTADHGQSLETPVPDLMVPCSNGPASVTPRCSG